MAEKKRSVGLVALTDLPAFGGRVAILQVRGEVNTEKLEPESWSGGCQVTVHGKLHGVETWEDALRRETREELGRFAGEHLEGLMRREDFEQQIVGTSEEGDKEVRTYGILVEPMFIRDLILHSSSGGIRLAREEQVRECDDLGKLDKKEGVRDRRVTTMFEDERNAVLNAFERFRNVPCSA